MVNPSTDPVDEDNDNGSSCCTVNSGQPFGLEWFLLGLIVLGVYKRRGLLGLSSFYLFLFCRPPDIPGAAGSYPAVPGAVFFCFKSLFPDLSFTLNSPKTV